MDDQALNSDQIDDQAKSLALEFVVSGQLFCLCISQVVRVIQYVSLQDVPGSASYVKGLINIQGHSIPVVDLAERLGLAEKSEYDLNTPIIICQGENDQVGLLVEQVNSVLPIQKDQLQMQSLVHESDALIQGATRTEDGEVLLIDVADLMKDGVVR